MSCNPLHDDYVQQLVKQLESVDVTEAQRRIGKWLKEERLTKSELVRYMNPYRRAHILGAPLPPFINHLGLLALMQTHEGRERMRQWEEASRDWRAAYLATDAGGGETA